MIPSPPLPLTTLYGIIAVGPVSIDEFYLKYLGQSRPVVVYVNGPDLCTFYDELTTRAGLKSTLGEDVDLQIVTESEVEGASAVVGDKTPLVLMTLGWDNNGSPFTHHWRECSMKVLELPEVVRWVVSHGSGNPPSPKVSGFAFLFGLHPRMLIIPRNMELY